MKFGTAGRYLVAVAMICSPSLARADLLTSVQDWLARPSTPHPAVARISVPEGGAYSLGSGTLVDVYDRYGLVLTNWHVVRDARGDVGVAFPNGFQSAARVLHVDEMWDLAALLVWSPPDIAPMALAELIPQPGDTLTIAGYGQGPYREATGHCTQYVAPGEASQFEMVEVSVRARQGDSGGPIINVRGELAGVLFGSTRRATSGSHVGRVRTFLAEIGGDHLPGELSVQQPNLPDALPDNQTNLRTDVPPLARGNSTSPPPRDRPVARVAKLSPSAPEVASEIVPPAPAEETVNRVTETVAPSSPVEKPRRSRQSPNCPAASSYPQGADFGSYPAQTITLDQLVGDGTWDKAKSVFALIGVIAVIRYFSQRESPAASP
jgi:hypothetical protein